MYPDVYGLHFQELNTADNPMPFHDEQFDIVYARLSLHYFTNAQTKQIFQQLHRILKPGGCIYFMCKSNHDVTHDKGEVIEKDVRIFEGHLRHFFSLEYTQECLKDLFTINTLEERTDELYGQKNSAFIECCATRI